MHGATMKIGTVYVNVLSAVTERLAFPRYTMYQRNTGIWRWCTCQHLPPGLQKRTKNFSFITLTVEHNYISSSSTVGIQLHLLNQHNGDDAPQNSKEDFDKEILVNLKHTIEMSVFFEQLKTRNLEINVTNFEEHVWSRVLVQVASNTCPNLSQNQALSQMFDAIYSELLTVSLSKPQIKKKTHCQQSRLHHSAAAVKSHNVNLSDACDN